MAVVERERESAYTYARKCSSRRCYLRLSLSFTKLSRIIHIRNWGNLPACPVCAESPFRRNINAVEMNEYGVGSYTQFAVLYIWIIIEKSLQFIEVFYKEISFPRIRWLEKFLNGRTVKLFVLREESEGKLSFVCYVNAVAYFTSGNFINKTYRVLSIQLCLYRYRMGTIEKKPHNANFTQHFSKKCIKWNTLGNAALKRVSRLSEMTFQSYAKN